jgi:hypothetical protein
LETPIFLPDSVSVARLLRDEARGRRVIARGEVRLLERFGGDADRGDGSVRVALVEARDEIFPSDSIHLALNFELLADGLGEIDVEAGQRADLVVIMERRIVAVGDEAELLHALEVRLRPQSRALPDIGDDFVADLRLGDERRQQNAERDDECRAPLKNAPRIDGAAPFHRLLLL